MLSGVLLVLLPSKKIAAARGLLPQVAFRIASDPSIYLAFLGAALFASQKKRAAVLAFWKYISSFVIFNTPPAATKNAK